MSNAEVTIDSVRVTTASPKRTIILKQKEEDNYLPFRVSPDQADILLSELQAKNSLSKVSNISLEDIVDRLFNVVICHENDKFVAKLLLNYGSGPQIVNSPIGEALAVAYRAKASILVDKELFEKAGVAIPA